MKGVRTAWSSRTYRSEHDTWKQILQRCYNPKCPGYKNYGQRGIDVSDRWRTSFANFMDDMGPRPSGCSLDRNDNDKGYSADNCTWEPRSVQRRNTRRNHYVDLRGRSMCITDAAKEMGMRLTVVRRLQVRRGISHQEVFDYYAQKRNFQWPPQAMGQLLEQVAAMGAQEPKN